MKIKVSVVGNCQARPIANLLEVMVTNIEVNTVAIVHLLRSEQINDYMPYFRDADFIVTQNIADNYPCEFVRTSHLSNEFGGKLIKIHNLFYKGYTPELMYLRLKGQGTLRGPLSDYHHQIIFESWRDGLSFKQTVANVESFEYWENLFADVHQQSISELRTREMSLDIKLVDDVEAFLKDDRLFFTFNHPCLKLILMLINKLSAYMSLQQDNLIQYAKLKEPLNQFNVPLSKYVTKSLSLKFDQTSIPYKGVSADEQGEFKIARNYTLQELIHSFFNLYEHNSELINSDLRTTRL
jgi:hypothetical protein